jgi:hypothetical protein
MNLEKLLAENMIRFGTRNLTERDVRKILKEQAGGAPGPVENANPIITAFINTPTNWGPTFTANVQTVTSLLNKYAIKFTNASNEKAAAFISLMYNVPSSGFVKITDVNKLKEAVEAQDNAITTFRETIIQLNESPDEKGKVLTVGTVSATGVSGRDVGNSSVMADIITYINDFNISKIASIPFLNKGTNVGENYESYWITPFKRGAQGGILTKNMDFITGTPGKTPGAGSLSLPGAFYENSNNFCIYASQNYTAASAASKGTQTTEITWTEGPETKADLPKNMFPVLSIKLDATLTPLITTAIESAKKIGQITGLRIESGASFDEPVKLDNAGFAKAVGMATNQVPADPTLDKEGVVTDPMSGGNAFLAIMRGRALQTAIGNLAGVTPTMVAKVATGGDAARYSALYFNIKMPDGSTTTTKDNLASIGAKTNVEQLGGQFKILRLEI